MGLADSHLQQLYHGFCKTPLLWTRSQILGLSQLQMNNKESLLFKRSLNRRLRLGQLAEQFVFNQLEQIENCSILAENIQIQKEKKTLGELDALIEMNNELIHLEIVYKFYLYDATLGNSEIERWIGPNRNDSLIEKVIKLKEKQLPLLYSPPCKSVLKAHGLELEGIKQQVLFKAQLFVPYQKSIDFQLLNKDCVCGFYINKLQLEDFSACKFYIPSKLDWFLEINPLVNWVNITSFKIEVSVFLEQNKSPLVWIKQPDDTLSKCFLVWW